MKPYLANVDGIDPSLPLHPTKVHPITGQPLRALGRTRRGFIWPQLGGSQPFGDPAAGAAGQQQVPGQPMQQTHTLAQIPVLGGGQVVAPQNGQNPYGPPQMQGQQPFQQQQFQAPQQQYQFPGFAPAGQPPQQWAPQGQQQPQQFAVPSPLQFAMQHAQPQQQGQNGQQPQGQQTGQQQGQGDQSGQQNGGQNNGPQSQSQNGTWDRPYPQNTPVEQMTVEQQRDYWKYHSRKNEALANKYGDYDQVKQAYEQLRSATATEWQRAQMEAEQRGAAMATQRAAAQLVQFAFQTAANGRATPEAINAQLAHLNPTGFMHNGQVNLDAVQHYVNVTWPAPQGQQQPQSLWMQPGTVPGQMQQLPGQPGGGYLQPGTPGYAQQPTFGPAGQPAQGYGQPAYAPQGQGYQQPGMPVQQGGGFTYPQPGVPQHYPPMQQQPQGQPVVMPAGMAGIPTLTPGSRPVTDFGQGLAAANPLNGLQAGAAVAASRHGGKTRSQQLAASQNGR